MTRRYRIKSLTLFFTVEKVNVPFFRALSSFLYCYVPFPATSLNYLRILGYIMMLCISIMSMLQSVYWMCGQLISVLVYSLGLLYVHVLLLVLPCHFVPMATMPANSIRFSHVHGDQFSLCTICIAIHQLPLFNFYSSTSQILRWTLREDRRMITKGKTIVWEKKWK